MVKRPALRYYGGKWLLALWIISHFPDHFHYVELCGGAASVLLRKPRSAVETYVDVEDGVVNFFRVLRNHKDCLIEKIRLTPWARSEYKLSREKCDDPIEWARRVFVSSWMSIGASGGWRVQTKGGSKRHTSMDLEKNSLEEVADRFMGVQIDNKGAIDAISRYDTRKTLFYFDPPYPVSTRSSQQHRYIVDQPDRFHVDCAELLRKTAGYVVVSGYACPLYAELYEDYGWHRVDKASRTNSSGSRVESLWLSPRTWCALQRTGRQGTLL